MEREAKANSTIHIGTSGWHYQHWKGNFYPKEITPSSMLDWYSQHFNTVEINNSFYRLPEPNAVGSWLKQTPSAFCFSLKASRYITHNRKLLDPKDTIAKFIKMTTGFGDKLGPILFQLPPAWKLNLERLTEFLKALPRKRRYTFEFRNPTWNTPKVYEALRRYNVALCISEIAGFRSPLEITADFVYVRLHGPSDKAYQGSYSNAALRGWGRKIEKWKAQSRAVYFYFDNDQLGFAAKNALELKRMVEDKD